MTTDSVELLDLNRLPTHLAQVARRIETHGVDGSADFFLYSSYLFEALLKTIGVVLASGVRQGSNEDAYRLTYHAIRADSLGKWDELVHIGSQLPTASFIKPELRPLIIWLSKRRKHEEDPWFVEAAQCAESVSVSLDPESSSARITSVKSLISRLVFIRNKTRGHGAKGSDFFAKINELFYRSIARLIENCPIIDYEWEFSAVRGRKNQFVTVALMGLAPKYKANDVSEFVRTSEEIHFLPPNGPRHYPCAPLLTTNRECSEFWFPNGAYGNGKAEYINYATGDTKRLEVAGYERPPASLPESETVGLPELDVQSNVFGNLPSLPTGYVERDEIQEQLYARLLDKNHPIITLHGRGGIGKTSLALFMAHKLAGLKELPFDAIVWFSGRDLDLKPEGPKRVNQEISDLESVAKSYGLLFNQGNSVDDFAKALQHPSTPEGKGTLYIFDNFETLTDTIGFHQFLDTHTHLPNKVLITSRERAFKADYPIEVQGMRITEARQLVLMESRRLLIEGLITEAAFQKIYSYSDGHAYVMRVLLGEIAKDGRFVLPKRAIGGRQDVVNAVFERSFDKLSDHGRHVFLTIGNRRSVTLELALIVVLGQQSVDVTAGLEECRRLSLITEHQTLDGQPGYSAPFLAQTFAAKKLKGDPEKLIIDEYLSMLQNFGVLTEVRLARSTQDDAISEFIDWCVDSAKASKSVADIRKLDSTFELVATLWPKAWLRLASFRKEVGLGDAMVERALRRAVEEMPYSRRAWLDRAEFAFSNGDVATFASSAANALDVGSDDATLMVDLAEKLTRLITANKDKLPVGERSRFISPVRDRLAEACRNLDDRGLGALAWLYLLDGNRNEARRYSEMAIQQNGGNGHVRKLLEQLGT